MSTSGLGEPENDGDIHIHWSPKIVVLCNVSGRGVFFTVERPEVIVKSPRMMAISISIFKIVVFHNVSGRGVFFTVESNDY